MNHEKEKSTPVPPEAKAKPESKPAKIINLLSGKWLIAALSGLIVILIAALLILLHFESNLYAQTGEKVEQQLRLNFETMPDNGTEEIVWCQLYEADTVLLINKNSLTGNEYRYLTKECANKVEQIMDESSSNMVMFWLKSNYEVVSYYELRGLNGFNNIKIINNYFAKPEQIGFTLKKEKLVVNRTRQEVISIK